MSITNPLEIEREAMRTMGYAVVDALVDRIAGLDDDVAWRGADRDELAPLLNEDAPLAPRAFPDILARLRRDVLAYAARVDHPRFMAFVPGSPTWPGILGDFLATGHNVFQGTWLGSSGPSALELVVVDWFRQWLGLPNQAGGLLLSGGSVANLTALACARANRTAGDVTLYTSQETHSSVRKAARTLGLPPERLRTVNADVRTGIDTGDLEAHIARDRASGLLPLAVIANAGTTSTGTIDDIDAIADICARNDVWLHVDAAYGGFAMLSPRVRPLLKGIERADSVTLDPHKWLFQPFETGCLLVKDARTLERAFHTTADYLQDTAISGANVNFGERGPQLTRAARAIKIWLSIQYFGLNAFRAAIDNAIDLVDHARRRIVADSRFELLTPPSLGIICFRRKHERDADAFNARIVAALAESGVGMISSTRIDGLYSLRFCILNHRTRENDVDRVLDWIADFSN